MVESCFTVCFSWLNFLSFLCWSRSFVASSFLRDTLFPLKLSVWLQYFVFPVWFQLLSYRKNLWYLSLNQTNNLSVSRNSPSKIYLLKVNNRNAPLLLTLNIFAFIVDLKHINADWELSKNSLPKLLIVGSSSSFKSFSIKRSLIQRERKFLWDSYFWALYV